MLGTSVLAVDLLHALSAAAALRSAPSLCAAAEAALLQGATWEDLEGALEAAAQAAADAVRREGLATLREVSARHGASERWGLRPSDQEEGASKC